MVTAAIHPFQDGNGRVCRVLASLATYRGGFKRKEFTSLEEWWGRHLENYYAAFHCLGNEFDATVDVTSFMETHARAQLSQIRALDLRERIEGRIWEALDEVVERTSLQPRLVNALWDAFFGRTVTPAYYIPLADVSRATATNDLAATVSAGLLESCGGGRSRHYVAAADLFQRVGKILNIELPEHNPKARIVAVLSRQFTQSVLD